MNLLLAVDWGSSSLRGALLDEAGRVVDERAVARGMLTVPPGGFGDVFESAFGDWMDTRASRCLMSGMVGSRQGWIEAPYCPCPAGLADVVERLQRVPADALAKPRRVAIVPGLSCERDGVPDVLRGEEVQIFGALELSGSSDGMLVLPGTHSKWARVEGGRVTTFSTVMSGEFYALLRHHSILARGLPEDDASFDAAAFDRGLDRAQDAAGLMHSAFSVRTLALFGRMSPAALPSYLSGLVVGDELRGHALDATAGVTVVGAPALTERFEHALKRRGVAVRRFGAEATWRGLWTIDRLADGAAPREHDR